MKANNKLAVVNMAFGSGSVSKEGEGFAKYVGIAPFFILGANLTMNEMKAIFPERNYTKEMEYKYDKPGEAKGTFVTFLLRTNTEHKDSNGIDITSRAAYLVKDEIYMNKEKTKVQIINDYGDTGWVTSEEFKDKKLPQYLLDQGYITTGMRPAYVGEAELVEFLKVFIGIPNSRNYTPDSGWTPKEGEELSKAIAGFSLEEIKKIANGDITAVKEAIKHQPKNQVKFFIGVRTTSDGKEYTEVCSKMPIRFGLTDYKKVDIALQKMKEEGAYQNTNFGVYPYSLQKYEVAMTTFTNPNSTAGSGASDPFAGFN